MTWAIVIPGGWKNPAGPALLDQCLNSIVEGGTADKVPVVVCWDQVKERIRFGFEEKFPFIQSIVNDGNRFFFAKNANQGLRFVHKLGYSALLVNQDCILPSFDELNKIPGRGIATPKTVDSVEVMRLHKSTESRQQTEKFPFFCPYLSKELMDEVGYLDEAFKHCFDDDDMLVRAQLAGFPTEVTDVVIVHQGSHIDQNAIGGSLTGAYGMEDLGIMLNKFIIKWSINLQEPGMITPQGQPNHAGFNAWIKRNYQWDRELMNCA